ncbi:hypothetical protein V5G24_23445 [Xanthobacter sp. VTT E-85241]|uniref:hypothetical protein n=1 Tax=Roseixanthobacter finlandensis TaxID=3119922 RepID=UPI00372AD29F
MAQADTVHTTQCPLLPVIQEVRALSAAWDRALVRRSRAGHAAQIAIDAQMEAISDVQDCLVARASQLLPESAVGAMFHIHLISYLAELVEDRIPQDSEREQEALEMIKRIKTMCYAVRTYIEHTSGARAEDALGEYYMARELDPHVLVEGALAA